MYTDLCSRDPHFLLLLSDFNAKSKTWYTNDQQTTEGTQLKSLTSLNGTKELIVEATQVLENFSSSLDFSFHKTAKCDDGFRSSFHSPLEILK